MSSINKYVINISLNTKCIKLPRWYVDQTDFNSNLNILLKWIFEININIKKENFR